MSEPSLSADDIAAHLGATKDTTYAWIAERAMPAHKVGRPWKFQGRRGRRLGAQRRDVRPDPSGRMNIKMSVLPDQMARENVEVGTAS